MTINSHNARRVGALAAITVAAAFALPAAANAAVTGAVSGNSAILTGDASADTIIIAADNGLLTHNLGTATGFSGVTDFDSTVDGPQTLTAAAGTLTIDGQGGDDIIVGGPNNDHLIGGDGNDRLTGAFGADDVDGGNGNDLMQWNNGDGIDTNDGDAGVDETLITGRNTTDDMTVANNGGGRVKFTRAAPGAFSVDMGTVEKLSLTPFQGDDKLVTAPDVTLPITVDAGPGVDNITTGGGADLILGGDDNDVLNGAGGGDRIVGDRGGDTMNGGDGDDTAVWNNGDGSDVINGDSGIDRVETNLSAADDTSTLKVENGRVRYDRLNPGPFNLSVATSEVFELNSLGGNDSLATSPGIGSLISVVADAGAGNDTFAGAEEADTFFGGSGDDVLDTGGGADVADGGDGNDSLRVRDGVGDLARGGNGADSAVADAADVDAIAADVESVDRPAAPDTSATAVALAGGARKVTLKKRRASVELSLLCPATEAGGCNGSVNLVSGPIKLNRLRTRIVVGSSSFSLRPGERRTVKVALLKNIERYTRKGKLAVTAQTITRDAAANVAEASTKLTLQFPKKK